MFLFAAVDCSPKSASTPGPQPAIPTKGGSSAWTPYHGRSTLEAGSVTVKRKEPTQTLTEQPRAAVVNCGLSHYRTAKDTGIAQPVITRFANGDRSISLETADKLAAFFGMRLMEPGTPNS